MYVLSLNSRARNASQCGTHFTPVERNRCFIDPSLPQEPTDRQIHCIAFLCQLLQDQSAFVGGQYGGSEWTAADANLLQQNLLLLESHLMVASGHTFY